MLFRMGSRRLKLKNYMQRYVAISTKRSHQRVETVDSDIILFQQKHPGPFHKTSLDSINFRMQVAADKQQFSYKNESSMSQV